MNLTNDDITKYFAKAKKEFRKEKISDNLEKLKATFAGIRLSLRDDARQLRKRIGTLSVENLANALLYQNCRLAISYLLEAIFYHHPRSSIKHYGDNFIRSFITRLSPYLTATLLQVNKGFQMKEVISLEDTKEMLIANFGLNEVFRTCPNFQYYYSQLRAKSPLIVDNQVECWLPEIENDTDNLIGCWEYVEGTSLAAVIPQLSQEDFLAYYTQVVLALVQAKRICQFTHYNLSPDNVIITTVPKITIGYTTSRGEVYHTTTKLVKIVDYRKSRAVINYYGSSLSLGSVGISIYPDKSWVLQDCYTLLLKCLKIAKDNGNKGILSVGKKILSYFISEDPDNYQQSGALDRSRFEDIQLFKTLAEQASNRYRLPYNGKYNIDFFVDYLRDQGLLRAANNPNNTVYQLREDLFRCLGLTDGLPDNILTFYDKYHILAKQQRLDQQRRLKVDFPYRERLASFLLTINSIRDADENLAAELDLIPGNYDDFKRSVVKVFRLVNNLLYYKFYVKICLEVCDIFDDIPNGSKVREHQVAHLESMKPIITKWNVIIHNNIIDEQVIDYWETIMTWS